MVMFVSVYIDDEITDKKEPAIQEVKMESTKAPEAIHVEGYLSKYTSGNLDRALNHVGCQMSQ